MSENECTSCGKFCGGESGVDGVCKSCVIKQLTKERTELKARAERAEASVNELEQDCDILSGIIKSASEMSSKGDYYQAADLLKESLSNTKIKGWISQEKAGRLRGLVALLECKCDTATNGGYTCPRCQSPAETEGEK